MSEVLQFAEDLISGMFPLSLLIIIGLYLTFKGRFFQLKRFPESARLVKKAFCAKKLNCDGISSWQSACTALSATVGTGNIAGVAGALSLGGAGAIFWMWVSAFVGMAIKFAEIVLAIIYRERSGGQYVGGPMYYIKNGLGEKFKLLSFAFAVSAIPAVICTGNITQTNAAVLSIGDSLAVRLTVGLIFTVLVAVVATGGAKRIGLVTDKIIPIMSILYIVLSLGVVFLNFDFLPEAFGMIMKGAFTPKAVTGGAVGSVITSVITGASRGVFSNEAGLGTSAMAHSAAFDADEKTQGLFGIFEVFVDTILICTLTALTILCSRVNIDYGNIASSELVAEALSGCYGKAAEYLLGIMMALFAFSSVIGWALYGDICSSFLFAEKGKRIFLKIYPLGCLLGALCNVGLAWRLSEFFNGIMLCINLPVVLLLSNKALKYEGENTLYEKKARDVKRNFRPKRGRSDKG